MASPSAQEKMKRTANFTEIKEAKNGTQLSELLKSKADE